MAYVSQYQYYENGGTSPENANWGSYQYVSLADIVNNFMLMHIGNHSLINNEERYKVIFHAKRAIQELNYDAFKEIKILELNVDDSLKYILPSDYVNWVRISLYRDGVLRPLTENIQTNYAKGYLQDNNNRILFDTDGNAIEPEFAQIVLDRIKGMTKSIYLGETTESDAVEGYYIDGRWVFDYSLGQRYGLNTETANFNPTFRIDNKSGVINFSSLMSNELCVLEYVSDGMEGGDNSLITVNKLFEKYVYAYIKYEILNDKLGVQEYIVNRARKEKTALLRNSRIRMSNMHPGRLLMNLRGQNKILK